jgi:hypothetical protein
MTADPAPEHVIARLRVRVAELRRLERDGAPAGELRRQRMIVNRLQSRLADAVRERLRHEPSAVLR